ncbi:MAG: aminoglycoside phosphotransferase family protein [Gammaproteobacteria bacterium]|nr:aminoglycoside phosphotransferase family protein [Gammaproteobacteria bacterium]
MNINQIKIICFTFKLGEPTSKPTRIYGGLLHRMWKFKTNKGTYAIKQLSQNLKLTPPIIHAYELTEQIAYLFQLHGIPAISAISTENHHLITIEKSAFLVYPWVEAKALDKDAISENHALQIAALLAKMHAINLYIPTLDEPEFDIHSTDKIIALINQVVSMQCPFAAILKSNQNRITSINDSYQKAVPLLKKSSVVSHGDLDQKNVLWDVNESPFLIDWESARKLNPTYEIINAALDWSGITTVNFSQSLFNKMLNTYIQSGGSINKNLIEAALYAVLGNWINWLIYNIERACNLDNNDEQRIMGIEQVQQVLPTLIRLEDKVTTLISLFK